MRRSFSWLKISQKAWLKMLNFQTLWHCNMYTLTVWIMHHPSRLHGYCGIYQIFNDDNDDSLAIFFSFSSTTYDVVHIIPEVTIRMRCLTRKNCGRKKLWVSTRCKFLICHDGKCFPHRFLPCCKALDALEAK